MSDSATEPEISSNSSSDTAERNPIEKLIVRLLIGALLVFMAIEAHAKFGYSGTLSNLQDRLEKDDTGEALNIENVPALISGFPSRKEHEDQSFTYRWTSLVKNYGIRIKYDDENHVMGMITDAPPEPVDPTPPLDPDSDESMSYEDPSPGGAEPGDGEQRTRPQRPTDDTPEESKANDTAPAETAPAEKEAAAPVEDKPTDTPNEAEAETAPETN